MIVNSYFINICNKLLAREQFTALEVDGRKMSKHWFIKKLATDATNMDYDKFAVFLHLHLMTALRTLQLIIFANMMLVTLPAAVAPPFKSIGK